LTLIKSEFWPILNLKISPNKSKGAKNETDEHFPKHHFPVRF